MRKTIQVLLFSFPIILSAQEFAIRWVPVNTGARSSSLGRSIVMDNGSSSLFHNPAAIGNYEYLTISAFASLNSPTQTSGQLESLSNNGVAETTSMKSPLNVVVVYPSPSQEYEFMKLVYGAGYSQYFQWVSEHSWSFQKDGSNYSRELDSSPGVNIIHMGVGARMWDRISLGVTLNFIPGGDYYNKDVLYIDQEYVDGFAETYTTNNTLFYSAGMLVNVTSGIEVGLTIKTPFEWIATEYWTSKNTIPKEHTLYKAPQSVGYGISYTKGSVRVQYEHSINSYSKMELNGSLIEVADGEGDHIGLEYTRNTSKIRVGYYSERLPSSNIDNQEALPISGFTFGYGHSFGELTMDLAFDHYSWASDAFMHPLLPSGSNGDDLVSGNIFIVGLTYSFTDGIPRF